MSHVRILVLPLTARKWFYYALPLENAAQQAAQAASSAASTSGRSLEDRIADLGSRLSNAVHSLLLRQWRGLETAKPGTLKARIYSGVQIVLSREDAQQTAFKAVPGTLAGVEVIYPSGLKEALVRRRMRLLLRAAAGQYQRTAIVWGLASLPLVPVLVLPVPAFPLYFTLWKAWSAQQALAGTRALDRSWGAQDAAVLAELRQQLLALQRSGVVFPRGLWPARVIDLSPRYLGILQSPEAKVLRFYSQREPTVPDMRPSQQLQALLQPGRAGGLRSDLLGELAQQYEAPALPELVQRALRQAKLPAPS